MGNFLGSTHVKIDSEVELKALLSKMAVQENFKCYISPPINGWVSIFRDQCGQIPLGESIAKQFINDIIDVMVHDDDVFCYCYLKNGQLIDSFNSCPDYFGETELDSDLSKGNPEVFKDLLADPQQITALKQVLKQKDITAELSDNTNSLKDIMDISNKLDELMKDPVKMLQVALENDPSVQEKIKSLTKDIPGEPSQEAIVKLLETKPELLQEIMGQVIASVMKQPDILLQPKPKHKDGNVSSDQPDTKGNNYLFASMQLQDFANIIGLPNAMTCYEYLEQAETDDIINWDKFIKIPK